MPRLHRSALAFALVCLVTACGQATPGSGSAGASSELSPEAAEAALTEAMVDRESIVARASGLTFTELFPQVGESEVLADAFRADVLAVDPGRAFGGSLDDDPLEELPFDDPQADWRSFHVRVKVVEVFSGDVTVGEELIVGLAFGSGLEMEVVSAGLMSMRDIVVFTGPGHFFLPCDSSTPVVWDGAFLSPVEGDRVPFPAVSEGGGQAASLVSRFDSLSELRKVAS